MQPRHKAHIQQQLSDQRPGSTLSCTVGATSTPCMSAPRRLDRQTLQVLLDTKRWTGRARPSRDSQAMQHDWLPWRSRNCWALTALGFPRGSGVMGYEPTASLPLPRPPHRTNSRLNKSTSRASGRACLSDSDSNPNTALSDLFSHPPSSVPHCLHSATESSSGAADPRSDKTRLRSHRALCGSSPAAMRHQLHVP